MTDLLRSGALFSTASRPVHQAAESAAGGSSSTTEAAGSSDPSDPDAADGTKAEDNGEGTGLVPVNNGFVHDTYRWSQSLQVGSKLPF